MEILTKSNVRKAGPEGSVPVGAQHVVVVPIIKTVPLNPHLAVHGEQMGLPAECELQFDD